MNTCEKCNRDSGCLHNTPISSKELYFLIGFILMISQFGYVYFYNLIDPRDVVGICLIAYGSIIIILTFMLLMYLIANKQYLALFFGCHQKIERSPTLFGTPFILCARCSGIFIGLYLSVIFFISEITQWYALLLLLPLIVDGIMQATTRYQSNNVLRFITGLLFAPGFVFIYGYANFYLHQLAVSIITFIGNIFM